MLRQDRLSGRWVMIAENRRRRPILSAPSTLIASDTADCPFCPGHEDETPPTVTAYPDTGPWQVRVIPNKYPAVQRTASITPTTTAATKAATTPIAPTSDAHDPFAAYAQSNYGQHEVVIESRTHVGEFSEVEVQSAWYAFQAQRDRMLTMTADPRLNYVQVFRNCGAPSGASIHHVHSQILATEVVPDEVQKRRTIQGEWFERQRECLLCRVIDDERRARIRTVAESHDWLAFCPFASGFAYEIWIVPRHHDGQFERTSDELLTGLAEFTQQILGRLRRARGSLAYNCLLHTAPLRNARDFDHWYWRITPRDAVLGGYELATNVLINTVSPETAASHLRQPY